MAWLTCSSGGCRSLQIFKGCKQSGGRITSTGPVCLVVPQAVVVQSFLTAWLDHRASFRELWIGVMVQQGCSSGAMAGTWQCAVVSLKCHRLYLARVWRGFPDMDQKDLKSDSTRCRGNRRIVVNITCIS